MTQHYQRNTSAVLMYCPTCGKKTMHQVNDRRVGACLEPHVSGLSNAQKKREKEKAARRAMSDRQGDLFGDGDAGEKYGEQ